MDCKTVTFIKSEANALLKLAISVSLSCRGEVKKKEYIVEPRNVYKVTVVDKDNTFKEYTGSITKFTFNNNPDFGVNSVSPNTKEKEKFVIDTITMDCSSDGESMVICIAVNDIRDIDLISTPYGNFETIDNIKDL